MEWIDRLICYLLCKLNNQWKLVGLDEGQEIFFADLSIECVATLIKLKERRERDKERGSYLPYTIYSILFQETIKFYA